MARLRRMACRALPRSGGAAGAWSCAPSVPRLPSTHLGCGDAMAGRRERKAMKRKTEAAAPEVPARPQCHLGRPPHSLVKRGAPGRSHGQAGREIRSRQAYGVTSAGKLPGLSVKFGPFRFTSRQRAAALAGMQLLSKQVNIMPAALHKPQSHARARTIAALDKETSMRPKDNAGLRLWRDQVTAEPRSLNRAAPAYERSLKTNLLEAAPLPLGEKPVPLGEKPGTGPQTRARNRKRHG